MARTKQTYRRTSQPTDRPTTGGLRLSGSNIPNETNHLKRTNNDKDSEEAEAVSNALSPSKRVRFEEPNKAHLKDMNGQAPDPPEFEKLPHTSESKFCHSWCQRLHLIKKRVKFDLDMLKLRGSKMFISFHYAFREKPDTRRDMIFYIPMEKVIEDQLLILQLFHNKTTSDVEFGPKEVLEYSDKLLDLTIDNWSDYGIDMNHRNMFMDRPTLVHFFFQHEAP